MAVEQHEHKTLNEDSLGSVSPIFFIHFLLLLVSSPLPVVQVVALVTRPASFTEQVFHQNNQTGHLFMPLNASEHIL